MSTATNPAVFIWGMGLIGTSLALRLREAGFSISGSVRSEKSKAELASLGFTDISLTEADSIKALAAADILILGLNLSDCYPVLRRVLGDATLKQKLIVSDICSTKRDICDFVAENFPDAHFVGAHPMAGKETQGPAAAEATLFEGSTVFLSALTGAKDTDISAIQSIWQKAGAKVALIDPQVHDKTMAYVSHGLHLASCLITNQSAETFDGNLNVSAVAGSYRDMTRIVQSSGTMWADITASNRENVIEWLRKLGKNATDLADQMENNTADIAALFTEAKKNRERAMRM